MSTNYYAEVDAAGRVLAIYGGDVPPVSTHAVHLLPNGLAGIAPSPSPAHVMDWNGGTIRWIDPTTTAQMWVLVRAQRDSFLASTDWRVTRAIEAAAAVPTAWVTYRQSLRDITLQPDPFNITWPTPPTA